jgi:hypothetical protein
MARANFPRNLRDLLGDVIDPQDHYVMPSGYKLSRADLQMLMQQQRFVNQPYDPWINTAFSPQSVNRVLQEMVDFMDNPPVRQGQRRAADGNQGDRNVRQRPNPNPPPAPPQAPLLNPRAGVYWL